jgi:hypothetical protein
VRWLRALLGSVFALGCGPIEAPPRVVDLGADPEALRAAFDGETGIPRLVLLLSPA